MTTVDEPGWPFDVPPATAVVTSTYVIVDQMPVLEVIHADDEEGGALWQFHSGNGDYTPALLRLVRLDEILAIAPELRSLATLPLGSIATRASASSPWKIEPLRR